MKDSLISVCAVLSFSVQSAWFADVPSFSLLAIWSINAGLTHTDPSVFLARKTAWCISIYEIGNVGVRTAETSGHLLPLSSTTAAPRRPMHRRLLPFFSNCIIEVGRSLCSWDFFGISHFGGGTLFLKRISLSFFSYRHSLHTHTHTHTTIETEKQCYQLSWFPSITPEPEATSSSRELASSVSSCTNLSVNLQLVFINHLCVVLHSQAA